MAMLAALLGAFDSELAVFLGDYGAVLFYLAVWALVFSGTGLFVGVFIPFITGDTLLFAAGLVAARAPSIDIAVLAIGVGIAAFLGDQLGYVLGRRLGRPYLERRRGRAAAAALRRSEHMYRLYGWWAIVVARFVPLGRVFVPVIAGVANMSRARFVTSNFAGAMAWGTGLVLTGYFAASIPAVKQAAYVIAGIVIAMSVDAGVRAWRLDKQGLLPDAD